VASFLKIAAATARVLRDHAQRVGEVQPPPSSRFDRMFASAVFWGLNVALLCSAALVLGFLTIGNHVVWLGWLRIVLGVLMVVEGLLLVGDWRGARRLVVQRIRQPRGGGGLTLSRLLPRQLTSLVLQLFGVAWLGAGTLAAARGVEQVL
jgi:hypothetical protein